MKSARIVIASAILLPLFAVNVRVGRGETMPLQEATQLAREYIGSPDAEQRAKLKPKLDAYSGEIAQVITALRPAPPAQTKRGVLTQEHFSMPGLAEKYREDRLNYLVPDSYDPQKPTGLLIYMHGGGRGLNRNGGAAILSDDPAQGGYGVLKPLKSMGFIIVAPSAPVDDTNDMRWSMPQVEEYLSAVVAESASRFAIDYNRVALVGCSMGGMGAYNMGLRVADRWSAVCAFSGYWSAAYWRGAAGTPFYILHGANDSVPPGDPTREHRPRYTDIIYAQEADRLLNKYGLAHVFAQHEGGHPDIALAEFSAFCAWAAELRRDPFQRRVVAATPADGMYPSLHNRWVSIIEIGEGQIALDGIKTFGETGRTTTLEQWRSFRYEPTVSPMKGGVVEAVNEGANAIRVQTENVKRFALWLHPKMVDFSKPITVTINDGKPVKVTAKPSLSAALDSYLRRQDWEMVYQAQVTLEVKP